MSFDSIERQDNMSSQSKGSGEDGMLQRDRWEEIRRLRLIEGRTVSEIARTFGVDRKTVRRCLREAEWQPYRRERKAATLLAPHADFLRERAPRVGYSARILFQELTREHGFKGSYETVKRFVAPLRSLAERAELTERRFETPPGRQSQIDWGQARVLFRSGPRDVHIFVLTLGFSRRSFYWGSPNERLGAFLEAHERAFEHFGGRTQEHLYDRARTVCHPGTDGKVAWNGTFRAFSDYWGFEPRLCQPYRARTKGKVESGVKYVKRNFLPGRSFIDIVDFQEQLREWNATVADVRIHGTTHEPPIERFAVERPALIPTAGHPSFLTDVRLSRIVASDYLVSVDTHRYSVPFTLIGQAVEVERGAERVRIYHRGRLVADHPKLTGRHRLSILPEHGPGAIARNARRRLPDPIFSSVDDRASLPQVEVRDLDVYEQLAQAVYS